MAFFSSLWQPTRHGTKDPPGITFGQSLQDFLAHYSNDVSPGTINDFHWAWRRLGPTFDQIQIAQLTPTDIEKYKAARLVDGVKKNTVNRELSYLVSIVRWAEDNHLIDPLPFRIKRFRKRDTRSPVPIVHTVVEMAKILEHIKPARRGPVLLMYDAGLRRNEALTLRGDQVEIEHQQIRVLGKGNKERIIPVLTPRLLAELKSAKETAGNGHLFINPRTQKPFKSIMTALRSAAARAGVNKRIYHHLLRHDHGTHTAIAGVDVRAVQRMLGHANLSTTELYTHLAGDYLRSEGKKFAQLIEQVAPPEIPNNL